MADFVQTMKEWTRMCRSHKDETDPCELCKLGHNGELCMAVYEAADVGEPDYAHIENVVARWAEEHPEPVYPTVYEWLVSVGLLSSDMWSVSDMHRPIPADIAEKLGIQPKEG